MNPPPTSDNPSRPDPFAGLFGGTQGTGRSLGELISPDDWRLYHIMRELGGDDRALIIAFAEMLFDLRYAQDKANVRANQQ